MKTLAEHFPPNRYPILGWEGMIRELDSVRECLNWLDVLHPAAGKPMNLTPASKVKLAALVRVRIRELGGPMIASQYTYRLGY